jgi:hypothetical protein
MSWLGDSTTEQKAQVMLYYDPKLKQHSRKLRNNSTLAAVLLWNPLKQKCWVTRSQDRDLQAHRGFLLPEVETSD